MIDYRSVIANESSRMLDAVVAGPLDARVPGCPDWDLAQLATHLGWVQRWATYIVTNKTPPGQGEVPEAPSDPSEAPGYLAASAPPLLAALDAANATDACWNFTKVDQMVSFWWRRQAIEVACHRFDAQSANGRAEPLDPGVAVDTIDEFLNTIVGRVLGRTKADTSALVGDVHVHCTDIAGEWTFQVIDGSFTVRTDHTKAAAALRGTASDLALYLYNRVSSSRLERFGDAALIDAWKSILRF